MSYIGAYNFTPRDLPAGYTQVEYIQSSGTQYIDTGFKPNQDTRVVCKALLPNAGKTHWLFGSRYSTSERKFAFTSSTAGYYSAHYNSGNPTFPKSFKPSGLITVDFNKQNISITADGGVQSVTGSYGEFTTPSNMLLFACDTDGSVSYGEAAIYSCQIYDNGTLIRDFVPCLKGNTPGLFDLANGVFYTDSSGAGGFVVGPTYGSFARRIKQIFVGVNTDIPIYGDEVRTVAVTASNIKELFDVANGSYYFAGSGGTFTSNNGDYKNTTASTILTAKMDMDVSFTYSYSSEKSYDVFTLKVGGTTVENGVSGATTTKTYSGKLTTGQTIEFSYEKDSSNNSYNDECTFSGMSVTATFRTQVGVETRPVARKVKKAYIGVANETVYGGTATLCYQAVD